MASVTTTETETVLHAALAFLGLELTIRTEDI
jgi:hypothetical protein